MRPLAFAVAATLAVVVAGCLSASPPNVAPTPGTPAFGAPVTAARLPPPTEDLSRAIVSDHGAPYLHAAQALHTGSYGLELVGYNPLTIPGAGDPPEAQDGAYGAIDVHENLVCVAHWAGSGGVGGGATLVDIADPAKPAWLASIPSLALNSDCQFTDDGRFLLLASYGGAQQGFAAPVAGDALAEGVWVYDVADPRSPKLVLHDTQGTSAEPGKTLQDAYHNVFTAKINGTNWVVQTYTGHVLRLADDGTALDLVATVAHTDHDLWIGRHPVDGRWHMITGAGRGTAFYDFEDPTAPTLVGMWEENGTFEGWHRQWPLANTVDGRALVVVAGETCRTGKSLPYTVLDWTDPADPIELGHWQIPGNPEIREPGQLCSMSAHEFETWDGYVATGNYHAGVWVFDVGSPERARAPATIGYYLPHEDPVAHGGAPAKPFAWSPDTWGAYFDARGYVVTADWATGLYVLKFGATRA